MTRSVLVLATLLAFGCDKGGGSSGDDGKADAKAAKDADKDADPKADSNADGTPAKPDAPSAAVLEPTGDAKDVAAEATGYWKYWGADKPKLAAAKLLVKGESAAHAVAFGALTITEAKTDQGEALKLYEGAHPDRDLRTSISYRDLGYPGTNADGVDFEVSFDHPTKDAKAVASLKGTIALRVFGKESALELGDLEARIGKKLDDPALSSAGVELSVAFNDESNRLDLEQTSGDLGQIGKVSLVGADGNPLEGDRSTDLSGPLPRFELSVGDRAALKTAKLHLTVYSDLEVLRAPFELTDVELIEN